MKIIRFHAGTQPPPRTLGLTRRMVRDHALRVFRDRFPARPRNHREWRRVEADLVRRLENNGW